MIIKVENTAISNGVAGSVKDFLPYIEEPILDYGAGKLRNAKFLVEEGYKVSVLDVAKQVAKWSNEEKGLFEEVFEDGLLLRDYFRTITLTFVLNVIPHQEIREFVLQDIHNALLPGGRILLEVRREKGILNSKNIESYKDGYILGSGKVKTFQKPFQKDELTELVSKYFDVEEVVVKSDSIIVMGVKR